MSAKVVVTDSSLNVLLHSLIRGWLKLNWQCFRACMLDLFFLGCPLVSFKEEMIKEITSLDQADREVICGTLFHTVNWFREVCMFLIKE